MVVRMMRLGTSVGRIRAGWLGLLGGVVLLATAASAWACFPQPYLVLRPQASGPAGSRITVEGRNFAGGQTELRWNAIDGQLLGGADQPSFSKEIAIPRAHDGLYTVLALTREASGGIGAVAPAQFQVTSSEPGGTHGAATPPAAASTDTARRSGRLSPVAGVAGAAVTLLLGGLAGAKLTKRRLLPRHAT